MYKVIDTITYKKSWTHRYPELLSRGEGVMVILDPTGIREAPKIQGHIVTIRQPDGSVAQFTVTSTEAHHSVVGLFFQGIEAEDVPPGSQIEW